jgi:hypothetical protein
MPKLTFDKRYWKRLLRNQKKTKEQYLNDARCRYVVLIDGCFPETWDEDGTPFLFDSFEEAKKRCIHNDLIINEKTFIYVFCGLAA